MRLLVLLPLLCAAACGRLDAAPDSERDAVVATVKLYFQGHATGDGAYFRRAFHPDAKLMWAGDDGALAQKTSAELAAGAAGKPADDEAKRRRAIERVDIAGTAAVAKVVLEYPTVKFVDYLSLLKLDGKWVIVHKIFHREPRAAAVPSRK